jgi:hypothetical protein
MSYIYIIANCRDNNEEIIKEQEEVGGSATHKVSFKLKQHKITEFFLMKNGSTPS